MRVVCMSDTHGRNQPATVPDGDILIHAGDLSISGEVHEIEHALGWLRKLPHKHKIFIGGNHDNALAEFGTWYFDAQMKPYKDYSPLIYLQASKVKVEGLTVFGSAALPFNSAYRSGARAFMLDATTHRHWSMAPTCDILISHGAPKGVLDHVPGAIDAAHCGDPILMNYVRLTKPKLHVFGHIHVARGVVEQGGTIFVNAAMLNDRYEPVHEPIVVDI